MKKLALFLMCLTLTAGAVTACGSDKSSSSSTTTANEAAGSDETQTDTVITAESLALEDGEYTVALIFEGGSGKSYIESPALLSVENGRTTAKLTWSSPNYDYMIVDGEKYLQVNTEGNSVFEIPVAAFDRKLPVIGNTTSMSKPHEIEYTLYFDSTTINKK